MAASNRRQLSATLCAISGVLGQASTPCYADIGKHAESSPEVQVYRALQNAFLEGAQWKDLNARMAATLCQPLSERRGDIDRLDSAGSFSPITGAATDAYPCGQLIEGVPICNEMVGRPYFGGPAGSVWRMAMHSVGYVTYVRELSRRAAIPPKEIEAELAAIDEATLASIQKTLAPQAPTPAPALGAAPESSLARMANDPVAREMDLKVKWNGYVLALPAAQQAKTPVLWSALPGPGQCYRPPGTEYLVRSVPPGAVIRMIADFDWQFCNSRKLDPWSDKCTGWSVVTAKRELLGTYRYEATWSDGKQSRRVVNVDGNKGDTLDLP